MHSVLHVSTRWVRQVCAALMLALCALPVAAQNTPGTQLAASQVSADVQQLFVLAEMFNPAVFGGASTGWRLHDGYTYQYFINSKIYAGVKDDTVYVLGGAYGNNVVPVGSLTSVLALLKEKTGATIVTPSREIIQFEYADGSISLPPAQTFTLNAKVPTGWTLLPGSSWFTLSQTTGTTGDGSSVTISLNDAALKLSRGKHTGLILARNESDQHLSVNIPVVLWVTDPGVAVTGSVANVLDFDVSQMVVDTRRARLYFSDPYMKRVYQVDAASGLTTRYFQFDRAPEHLTISPDGSRLYAALVDRPHSAYWWDNEQSGAIGIINLDRNESRGSFAVDIDPFDIVATDNGKVFVSGGSGQWTTIDVFDAVSGAKIAEVPSIYMGETLTLHPNQQMLYSSGSHVVKFDVSGTGITKLSESPYYGDHPISTRVWISPSTRHLYTPSADVFLSTSFLYVNTLANSEPIADLAFDTNNSVVILTSTNKLQRYGVADYKFLTTVGTGLVKPSFVRIVGGDVIVVDFVSGKYLLKRF